MPQISDCCHVGDVKGLPLWFFFLSGTGQLVHFSQSCNANAKQRYLKGK